MNYAAISGLFAVLAGVGAVVLLAFGRDEGARGRVVEIFADFEPTPEKARARMWRLLLACAAFAVLSAVGSLIAGAQA